MIHPMLMPREPAPEIDVSKPALPKKAQASECAPTPTIERLEPMWLGIDPAQPGGDDTATVKYRRDEGGNVVVQHVISVKAGRLWIKDIDLRPGNLTYTPPPPLRDEWASEWDITPDKIWHRVES